MRRRRRDTGNSSRAGRMARGGRWRWRKKHRRPAPCGRGVTCVCIPASGPPTRPLRGHGASVKRPQQGPRTAAGWGCGLRVAERPLQWAGQSGGRADPEGGGRGRAFPWSGACLLPLPPARLATPTQSLHTRVPAPPNRLLGAPPVSCGRHDWCDSGLLGGRGGGRRGQRARTGLGVKCAVKKSSTEGGPSFIAAARSRAKTLHLMSRRSLGPSSRRRPALPSVGPPLLASHPHPSYQVRDEPTCHAAPSKPWAPFQRVQTLRHDGRFVPNSTARGDGRQKRHWKQAAQRGRKRPPPAQGERCRRAGQHGHRHLVARGPRWQA